mmetsp:Transcript_73059/g.147052  ORF Transcript_73059/g.147052 Transcript_73059/m.147052 type:complete len:198 (+) Transcript_73059:514-1107(+)
MKANTYSEVALVKTARRLEQELKQRSSDTARVEWLREQVHARTLGRSSVFTYEGINARFLSTSRKLPTLKLTANGTTGFEAAYLADLMRAVIAYDISHRRYSAATLASATAAAPSLARQLPLANEELLCSISQAHLAKEKGGSAALMVYEDCNKLKNYEGCYLNKVLYDVNEKASFKILKISNLTKKIQRREINRTS